MGGLADEKRNKNAGKVAKDFHAAQTRRKWIQAQVSAKVERIIFMKEICSPVRESCCFDEAKGKRKMRI